MYEVPTLSRDPFAAPCDGSLYWENRERRALRGAALDHLRSGVGVWLSGPPGSGRSTLLARVAEEGVQAGLPVLWSESPPGCAPEVFLEAANEAVSDVPPSGDLLSLASGLYARLLEGFAEAGTVLCFPGLEAPTVGALAEAAILSRFRLAGRPLAVLALCGDGEPPFPGLEKVTLPCPSPAELESCLRHRAAGCGKPDALSDAGFASVASSARGFGDALARARRALSRAAFRASLAPKAEPPAMPSPGPVVRAGVLDPAQLSELSSLLESL